MNGRLIRGRSKGFTLIELLVVIAIIGILSSVVLASLNTGRTKAQDAKRISTMGQLRVALELYYSSYGFYPGDRGRLGDVCLNPGGSGCANTLDVLQSEGYLSTIPSDPTGTLTSNAENYFYKNTNSANALIVADDSNASTYAIRFQTRGGTTLGPAGYYCATSQGLEPAVSNICTQK